ncbi:hypothetical protein [Streptomyces sp. NBC_01438]|uniref:hypothetical protein n=1 Tax=Streptomyces sp. NBC_01438 TaxID=2903866 RepID=UPI0032520D22
MGAAVAGTWHLTPKLGTNGAAFVKGTYAWEPRGQNHGGFHFRGSLTDGSKSDGNNVYAQAKVEGYGWNRFSGKQGKAPLTVRAAQCIQVLLPLAVGLFGALVSGRLAESSYLITGGGTVHWDGDGLPLLVVCTVGILLFAALASLPLTHRHVELEHIRRD